ncbi:MAG: hypothetical protein IT447_14125 [Phycisphaerales bacterium]|jgi:hypothetical protein|nr:hypothetical protein [Phycisphaerales bacterium]
MKWQCNILLMGLMLCGATTARGAALKNLNRIYLSCHASPWISRPAADPEHKQWETWPGRNALIKPMDYEVRRRFEEIMQQAKEDEGLFVIPSYPASARPATEVQLIVDGQKFFGKRCVVTSEGLVPAGSLGTEFAESLTKDRQLALAMRSKDVSDEAFEHEFSTWVLAKSWITDLKQKLAVNGYTFDPMTVEFVCWGSDFRGCAASYPIMMGRALKLKHPIERRWDLIVHDEGKMVARSQLVVQNVKLAGEVRLFIFKNEKGWYCADFWEGMHGPMDRARRMALKFPAGSVRCVDYDGQALDGGALYGELTVPIGCGGHTPHHERIIEATERLSLDEFYSVLVNGRMSEIP